MQIDAILGLMRMADDNNTIVANLARMILGLVEGVRDLEMKAGLAEAALDAERAKVTELQAQVRRLGGEAPISGSSVVRAPAMA